MSDGPQKVVPKAALPLDEIILGEDEAAAAPPPKPSSPPPGAPDGGRSSVRPKDKVSVRPVARDSEAPRPKSDPELGMSGEGPIVSADGLRDSTSRERKRAKMTLRIPDDEVSRPKMPSVETPAAGVAAIVGTPSPGAVRASRPPPVVTPADGASASVEGRAGAVPPAVAASVKPASSPDDTLELPPDELKARMMRALGIDGVPRAIGVDTSHEPGWTPYQPPVAESASATGTSPSGEVVSPLHKAATPVLDLASEEEAPVSEDIPVETEEPVEEPAAARAHDDDELDETATLPRLPTVLDSEEIRIEDGDRVTDPGAEEVSPDDLVSVESLPSPHAPPPPPRGGKGAPVEDRRSPAVTAPAVTATALMAGAAQPPVVVNAPVATPAQATAAAPPAAAATAPVAAGSAPAARAPVAATPAASPVIVPPVGALAPPPMNEAAANRKKTRPWWEDLFNDDFIRTMAKLTDGQIAREVDFIEESLGCEAGAMILDLACGTGRHTVELATRGYQVVGFDLSLSMLARASDEAQDRKQKINFVQGDMREMTFEETFDGIYSWNTSFGYFDEEKNAACIAKVHRALKKGGQFLLDVVNRDYIIRQSPSLAWYEGDGCICMDEMQIDWITSRMKVKRTLMMDDGRTKEIEYSIRVYSLHELGKLLHDNGFRVAEVSGRTSTPGVFFGCEAPRTLILAEKR